MESWVEEEVKESTFPDQRLKERFTTLLEQLSSAIGKPISFACQDWSNTKAAYRFFSNERFDESDILKGHFQSTKARFDALETPVLILHDTTEFSYTRENPSKIGITKKVFTGRNKKGIPNKKTLCGLLMHSSFVVTPEGLPLGLIANKFWTRKKFKGTNQLKKKINISRIPIEQKESFRWIENLKQATTTLGFPERCIHVGDRESDIYELFCAAQESKSYFLFRTCEDRLAEEEEKKLRISEIMKTVKIKGTHQIEITDKKGMKSTATLEIKYKKIKVLPPVDKKNKNYPSLVLTMIHAEEKNAPTGREPIFWKLITNLPIHSKKEVIEKLDWYALRWKIETFFKILKSGCKSEELKMRTAERLTKSIAVFCIISWRIFWMTMLKRVAPNEEPTVALTDVEIQLIEQLLPKKNKGIKNTISDYLLQVAKLGGYLARNSDPPPGNLVIWRGLSRLMDIQLGFNLGLKIVGN